MPQNLSSAVVSRGSCCRRTYASGCLRIIGCGWRWTRSPRWMDLGNHSTIARFIERHEQALAGVFSGVLRGMREGRAGEGGVIAVDGSEAPGGCQR